MISKIFEMQKPTAIEQAELKQHDFPARNILRVPFAKSKITSPVVTAPRRSEVLERRTQAGIHPGLDPSFRESDKLSEFRAKRWADIPSETQDLIDQARPTDQAASDKSERNQKVIAMLPLLHRLARKMRAHLPSHVEVEDLVGAGAIGLIDAVERFDASKKVKLESYAQHRIRGAIIDSLRSMDSASRDHRQKSKKTEAAYHKLENKLGRHATDEEFARAQGITLNTWYRTVQELQALGLEWLRPSESPMALRSIDDICDTPSAGSQFDLCYLREKREIMTRALDGLPQRERLILLLYYSRQITMKEIAAELKVDQSRISQLHSAALLRLRTSVMAMLRAPRYSEVVAQEGRMAA